MHGQISGGGEELAPAIGTTGRICQRVVAGPSARQGRREGRLWGGSHLGGTGKLLQGGY